MLKASQYFETRTSFVISYPSLLSSECLLKADGVRGQLNISAIRAISHNYLPFPGAIGNQARAEASAGSYCWSVEQSV